jgi:hypothetical protein
MEFVFYSTEVQFPDYVQSFNLPFVLLASCCSFHCLASGRGGGVASDSMVENNFQTNKPTV